MSWTEYDRRQLAEYCKEHDRLMVEEREMAERELIYKEKVAAPGGRFLPFPIDDSRTTETRASA